MNNNDNAATIFARLIEHLKKNHTLSEMNSSLPKADNYHAFLGRGESIIEVLAKACNVHYEVIQEFERQSSETDYFMIHKVYLEGLLKDSKNDKAINVIVAETGIKFKKTKLKTSPLNFVSIDDDEMVARTPFLNYEIWKYPTYWRAKANSAVLNGEELGKRRGMTLEEAKEVCNKHYMEKLNQANAELVDHGDCERCSSLEDNPTPCCDNGKCEAKEGDSGTTNCIHCGGELQEVNGMWYHHSQIEQHANDLGDPQDIVR
jgi:hypothetical protein